MSSLIKFNQDKSCFILCSCKSEILYLNYDAETKLTDMCFYHSIESAQHQMSLWTKIKTIWQVLRKGTIYPDQIVLDKNSTKELCEFLQSICTKGV